MSHGPRVIRGKPSNISMIAWEMLLQDFGMTRTWQPGTSMPVSLLPQVDHRHQPLMLEIQILKLHQPRKEILRLIQNLRRHPSQRQHLFFPVHNQSNTERGKGKKGKSKLRSASPKDKSKIPCHFHFVKKSCTKGKDCAYIAMAKKYSTQIERREKAKVGANQDLSHLQTDLRRRTMLGVGKRSLQIWQELQ